MSESKNEVLYEVHLSAFGMSRRGVRVRQLDPVAIRECEAAAAGKVGLDGAFLDLQNAEIQEGICRMVREITDPVMGDRPNPEKEGETIPRTIKDPDVEWRPMNLQRMKAEVDVLFTAKDLDVLGGFYNRLHKVSQLELEVLLGKALPVSTPD